MLSEKDIVWKEAKQKINGQDVMADWYCLIDCGKFIRLYAIQPQYPWNINDVESMNELSENPELYILWGANGHKPFKKSGRYYWTHLRDGYVFEEQSLIRVLKTLDEAKGFAFNHYMAEFSEATLEVTSRHRSL